jgi:apolipoprotein N-acyltransferase
MPATLWTSAVTGWWFGFGFFLAGLWWLGAAFLVEADRFAWLMPLAVVGLPAVLALFHALGFMLARLVWSQGIGRILALTWGLGLSEWLRGHVLTGFPWNSYGMAFAEHLWLAQIASIIGLYGLTALSIFLCALPATLTTGRHVQWRGTCVAMILLVGLAGYGAWRIPANPVADVANVKLRIMQPNLPQDAKFRVENREEIMKRYLDLSDRATSPTSTGVADITHLIWPESAFPFILAKDTVALTQIAELLPQGVTLITGAATLREGLPGETRSRYRNSIQVINHDGSVQATADKVHLVPFGEYLPFMDWLQRLGLRQLIQLPGGFEAAERQTPLSIIGLPLIAPLICYEAIFPNKVIPQVVPLASDLSDMSSSSSQIGLMLNVTNDAWFGKTWGPYQHFAQARLRTIEEGVPLVRAANTGISAVIDPYGRIRNSLPLGYEGVLDSNLPQTISMPPYARFGDLFFINIIIMCFGIASVLSWKR